MIWCYGLTCLKVCKIFFKLSPLQQTKIVKCYLHINAYVCYPNDILYLMLKHSEGPEYFCF